MTASDETIQALVSRFVSLQRGDLYAEAERAYRGALAVDDNYTLAQTGFAATLQESRKRDVILAKINISMGSGRKPQVTTVSIQGTIAERRRQEAQDVIDAFQAAADRAPNDGLAASQLYFEKRHACDWAGLCEIEIRTDALTATVVDRGTTPGEHAFIHTARVEDTAKTTKATSAGASSRRPINSSISKSFRTKPRRRGSKAMESTFLST